MAAATIAATETMLFTGTMSYEPNRDSVHYFVKEILPLIKIKLPGIKFIIAGANAAAVFPELKGDPSIGIISSPEDMKVHYDLANIVVVPLRSGSGTRLKILEAMAMGKPVVTTPIGVEGIEATHEEEILVAKDIKEFAEMVVSLLKDKALAGKISKKARLLIESKYNWDDIRGSISMSITSMLTFYG